MRPKRAKWLTYDRTRLPAPIEVDHLGDEFANLPPPKQPSRYNLRSTVAGRGITKPVTEKTRKSTGWFRLGLLSSGSYKDITPSKKTTGVAKLTAQLALYGNEINGKPRSSSISEGKDRDDRRESFNSMITLSSQHPPTATDDQMEDVTAQLCESINKLQVNSPLSDNAGNDSMLSEKHKKILLGVLSGTGYIHPAFKLSYEPLHVHRAGFTLMYESNFTKDLRTVKFILKEMVPEASWVMDAFGNKIPHAILDVRANTNAQYPMYIHEYEDETMIYIITAVHGQPTNNFVGDRYTEVEWDAYYTL